MTWLGPRPRGGQGSRLLRRCSVAWTLTGTAWSAGRSLWSIAAGTTGDQNLEQEWRNDSSRGGIDPEPQRKFLFIITNYCYLHLKLAVWEDQFELIGSWTGTELLEVLSFAGRGRGANIELDHSIQICKAHPGPGPESKFAGWLVPVSLNILCLQCLPEPHHPALRTPG